MAKTIFLLFILISSLSSNSQSYIKGNAASALLLIPNFGYETKLNSKFSFQLDVTASFWKSFDNSPFEFVIVTPEIRYHFAAIFSGFYLGGHLGGSAFKLQKWEYKNTNYYQEGYNYLIGGTIGYQKHITEKLILEVFIGGGSQQAFYKGYDSVTGKRVEKANDFNKSGEWLPYRGGIMICYKLN